MNRNLLTTAILLGLFAASLGGCSSDKTPGHADATEAKDAHGVDRHEDAHDDGHADKQGAGHADAHGDAHGGEAEGGAHRDAHGDEAGGDEHGHGEEGETDFARIDPASAAQHGIEVSQAAGGPVAESISLTGRLIIDPRAIALVRARFAGPVRSVPKDVGDAVRKGDVLAQVESNDSLTVYDVRSPISGVVLERMTNAGDVAGSEPLFRIGDLSTLQAELKVFRTDQSRVRRGAAAVVRIGDQDVSGKVINLVPELESRTQAMLVRIELVPRAPLAAVPGQFITGQIMTGQGDAAVTIAADAVQRFEGREVVFVPEEAGFRARAVTLGRRSLDRVEIVTDLQPGERYVSAGAFLIKAEIGKGAGGHDH